MLFFVFLFFAFGSKTCLNLAISRIKLLQNKRDVQLKQMRKEIFQFLQAGQEAIARIRVIPQLLVTAAIFASSSPCDLWFVNCIDLNRWSISFANKIFGLHMKFLSYSVNLFLHVYQ